MDFFNINSNFIKNSNNKVINNDENKIKAKVLFANKDSLIVSYKGKILLLENTSNSSLKPGMIINLSFNQIQQNSKNQIFTKALGEIIDNIFNINLKINEDQINFEINLTNISDEKKFSFIKWLSDFFTTLDKNINKKFSNNENILSNDKIKFMLKNIIEDIAKNFTKNKTINPDPIQFAKNIAKKLFSFINKDETKYSEKNVKPQISKGTYTVTNNDSLKKTVFINGNSPEKENNNNSKNINNNILKNNSTQKNILENSKKDSQLKITNFSQKTDLIKENSNVGNKDFNKSSIMNEKNKKIAILKTNNSNQNIDKSQLKNTIDNFIKSSSSNKNLFVFSNNKNTNSIDPLSKFIMTYKKSNEFIFINNFKKNLINNNKNQERNLIIKTQKPVIKNLDPKVIIKTTINKDNNIIENLNKNNFILKPEKLINKIFINLKNFSDKENIISEIKKNITIISNNLKNNSVKITNFKNILIMNSNSNNSFEEFSNNSFKLIFNHKNLKSFNEDLKNILDKLNTKNNFSNAVQDNLLSNTINKAISAYQNMEGMKNLNDTSYMIFNMFGIPIYLSFRKEEIVQNEKNKNTKSYGKIRVILPTDTFGVVDINLFMNEKDAFINIKMQKNTDIFEKNIDKLKNNIEKHKVNIHSLSIKEDTELINIEREISVF